MRKPVRNALGLVLSCALVVALSGCALSEAEKHPAAEAVEGLLRVRLSRDTDPKNYVPYLGSSDAATALAEDASLTASSDRPALPGWDRPYVSALTTKGADVVVVWKPNSKLPDWASEATVFSTEETAGHWVVVDALALESSAVPDPWQP